MNEVQYGILECSLKVSQSTEKNPMTVYLHVQKQSSLKTVGQVRVSTCISSMLGDCNLSSEDLSKADFKTRLEKRSLTPCNER